MAMTETVDALELQIRANAQSASEKISALATSVEDFGKKISDYLGNLKEFSSALKDIAEAAGKLSGVKNMKTLMSGVAATASAAKGKIAAKQFIPATASAAKGKIAAKQFIPAIPPARPSNTVNGRNRVVNWAGRGIRRFDMTADDVARQMNRDLGGTRMNNKELSAAIQEIRQNAIGGKDVVGEIEKLANELAGGAGRKNVSQMIETLNSKFGKQFIGVTEKDIKGAGMSITAMNDLARSQGGRFGFRMMNNSPTTRGLDEMPEELLRSIGVASTNVEDLVRALETNANVYNGHNEKLGELRVGSDAELFPQVFDSLLRGVLGSSNVDANPAEAIKKAASEATQVVKEIDDMERLMKMASQPQTDWHEDYKPRPGIRSFEEYEGKDWRKENENVEADFNRRFSEILQMKDAEKNIKEATRTLVEEFQANGGIGSGAKKVEEEAAAAKEQTDALAESARYTAEAFANTVSPVDLLQMKLDGVGQKLEEALNSENEDPKKIAALTDEYQKLADKIEEAGAAAEENSPKITMKDVFGTLGKSLEKSVFGQLARVARMRGLRAIVKGAASALKEGIGNLYQWSKGLNGSFASALDTAASKAMLMKNSIATALAPAIQAMIPLLSTVTNWIRSASNAIAQFFALLTGQDTWTMATESVEKWAEATKTGATGAGKAVKDLLADWDELNVIQSETGGGGGSGSGKKIPDYNSMFKEMTVFDEWTKQFDNIKSIVAAIGAGIAGWFVISNVQDFLGKLGIAGDKVDGIFAKIKKGVTGAILMYVGFELSSGAGASYANNGFTWAGFAQNVIGAIASGIGGWMLASTFGINPVIGVALGLGLSIFATIRGFEMERNENAKEYIRNRLENEIFKFDVHAVAEDVEVTLADANRARKEVSKQLTNTLQTINAIELGMDSETTWSTLYGQITGENGLISKIQETLKQDTNVLTMYYSLSEKTGAGLGEKDEQGNYKNLDAFKIDMEANSWLQDEYRKLGERFASCFVEGEKGKIAEGKKELALEIAKQIAEAERAAEEARGEAQAEIGMVNALKGTDAKHVVQNFNSIVDEYEDKLAEARKSALEGYIITEASTLAQLEKLGADQSLIDSVKANLEAAQEEFKNTDFKAQVHLEYADKEAKMLQNFIRDNVSEITGWDQFKNRTITGAVGTSQTPEELAQRWGWQLYGAVNEKLGLGFDDDTLKKFGVTLSDVIGDDIEAALRELAANQFGEEGASTVMGLLGFGESELDAITAKLATDASLETVGSNITTAMANQERDIETLSRIATRCEGILRSILAKPTGAVLTPDSTFGRAVRTGGGRMNNVSNVAMEN